MLNKQTAAVFLRPHTLLIVILLLLAPVYFVWTGNNQIGQFGGDGASYLMMAQHYSFTTSQDPVYASTATFTRFPPLYPLVLAQFGASVDLLRAHLVTISCLMVSLAAFYAWLFGEGFAPSQSALLVLMFAILPGTWLLGLSIQSEYLYLFFSLLALSFLAAYERSQTRQALYAAAVAITAATLTRTIGIALFVPFLAALLRAPKRSGALAVCIAGLPLLLWHLLHTSQRGRGYGVAFVLSQYGSGDEGLKALGRQLATEVPALYEGFVGNFVHGPAWLRLLPNLLMPLSLAGLAWRLIKLKPDGLYVVANLAILLIWPFPEEARRFLWVVVPLLIAQPLLLIADLREEFASARIPQLVTAAFGLLAICMSCPAISLAADRYRAADFSDIPNVRGLLSWYALDPVQAESQVQYQFTIINALLAIPEDVPSSECVISIRPDLINYYSHRAGVRPPIESVADPQFAQALKASGCHFVFGSLATDQSYPTPFYPLTRISKQSRLIWRSRLSDDTPESRREICALIRLSDAESPTPISPADQSRRDPVLP